MTLFLKLRFSSIFAQQGGPVRAVLTLAGALMDDPHHIFLRKGDTRFFLLRRVPPCDIYNSSWSLTYNAISY